MGCGGTFWSWRLIVGIALFLHSSICASEKAPNYSFVNEATAAPSKSYYDYIIIGGGTAGCPLAATLSQKASVLLLERGGSPYHNPNITNLFAFGASLSDLSPTSPSQRFISEDGVVNARARVLGGGSALNAGFYTRAARQYFRDVGWEERLVNESYRWVEAKVAFEPPMGRWQSAVRDGLIEAGVLPNNGFTYDHINGTKFGGTIFDRNGVRHTAADLLQYANPKGITVLLHATVHRILFSTKGKTKAHGVVFRDGSGKAHWAYLKNKAHNDIVLSAGALGSPQLLMLSGVGPSAHLKAHNITVVMDQPHVGQGMSDNPMNAVFVPSPVPVEVSLIEVVGITEFGTYIESAGGENFAVGGSTRDYGLFSPKIDQLSTVPPKQRTPEAISKAIESMNQLSAQAFQGGFILEKVMGPLSTGHLQLRTRDPAQNPTVTFNYFQNPLDLKRCVQGLMMIEKVIKSKAFSEFKYPDMSWEYLLNLTASSPVNMLPHHGFATSSLLEQFCRDTLMTIWHYHGGCHVGKVVDMEYRVMGVDRVRVIDTSTLGYCPGTNPQATVMMLGRYMGVRMLRERLANKKRT